MHCLLLTLSLVGSDLPGGATGMGSGCANRAQWEWPNVAQITEPFCATTTKAARFDDFIRVLGAGRLNQPFFPIGNQRDDLWPGDRREGDQSVPNLLGFVDLGKMHQHQVAISEPGA